MENKSIDNQYFVKLYKNASTLDLIRDNKNAFVLLSIIAIRCAVNDTKELKKGQCYIGDYKNYGMTRSEYRHAIKRLCHDQQTTIKTTNKGTIVTLCDSLIYNVQKYANDQQNDQPTTTKEDIKNIYIYINNNLYIKEGDDTFNLSNSEILLINQFYLFYNSGLVKINKKGCFAKFKKLSQKDKVEILGHIPKYLKTNETRYLKNTNNYLSKEQWKEELFFYNNQKQTNSERKEVLL